MNKIIKIAAATALIAASASASAWWGNPVSSFTDEFFGDDTNGTDIYNLASNGSHRLFLV